MNIKKNINADILKVYNNEQNSLSELQNLDKNKEMLRFLNRKKIMSKTILQRIKNKDNNKLKDEEKNRNIKRNILKEKNLNSSKKQKYKKNSHMKGKVYCFFFINNNPIFTLGPQYYYSLLIISFNNGIFFLLIKYIYEKINFFFEIASISILIIVNFTHLYTVFINPGIPKKSWFLSDKIINLIMIDENIYREFNTNKYQICRKCNFLIDKSLRIIHCDICSVCCENYHHHCQWIGKCIGKNNLLSFKFFVISNIIYILLQIIVLFLYLIKNNYFTK